MTILDRSAGSYLAALALLGLAALLVITSGAARVSPGRGAAASAPRLNSPEALAAVRAAAARAASETATFSLTLSGGTGSGAAASAASGSGAFDFPARRGEAALSGAGPSSDRSFVFTPDAVYVRATKPSGSLRPAGTWTTVRFSNAKSVRRDLPNLIGQLESLNPALTLSELVWGATRASASGHDVILGQVASTYDLTIQPAQALANATGAETAFAIALESQMSALAPSTSADGAFPTFGARVWLSAQGRLLGVEFSPPGAGVGNLSLKLESPGSPVHVVAPPADQVVDLASLIPPGERENHNGGDSDGA